MTASILVELHVVISKAALFVSECAVDQLFELLRAERFESKNLRARDERADQAEISSFDIRQKNVLLRFVEMMDLINEQDRPLSRCAETIRRCSDDASHFGHVTFHAADSNEFGVRHFRNHSGQRGLAASRWPGKNHRRQTISLNRAS